MSQSVTSIEMSFIDRQTAPTIDSQVYLFSHGYNKRIGQRISPYLLQDW
jgi:hypothetical protein